MKFFKLSRFIKIYFTELTKIDVETVASMTAYIGTMKQVITLDTRDLGLKSLAHSLAMMTNLRSLDLSHNNIYDLSIYPSDVSVLEPIFMAAIEHLTFLNLGANNLGKREKLLEVKFKKIPGLTYNF